MRTPTYIIAALAFSIAPAFAQDVEMSAPPALSADQSSDILAAIRAAAVVPETNMDFDPSIGAKVPQHVTLLPLPLRAIQLLPNFEGYLFFLLPDGRAPIVSPTSLEIVFILE